MAARANIIEEAEKGLTMTQHKKPDGENKKAAEKVVELKLREPQYYYSSCFKPKVGSVFPAQRKSVKRMMFDRFVVYFRSVVSAYSPPSSSLVVVTQSPQA